MGESIAGKQDDPTQIEYRKATPPPPPLNFSSKKYLYRIASLFDI